MSVAMMRAARFHAYGPPENLVVEQVPRPVPASGEVLVRVHAAGVNPIDWKLRTGTFHAYMPVTMPHIPGVELAGTVEAVGDGVTEFRPGDAVFGRGAGTYAEYAISPANALARKPAAMSFDQAATVQVGAVTAWAGLFDVADLQAGQQLLVHAAAGGVGHFAVQLGHWKGAHVTGTASAGNLDFVRSLGADHALDYNATPFERVVRDMDVILDPVGGAIQERSLQVLKSGGMLVAVAGRADQEKAQQLGVRTANAAARTAVDALLNQIAELIEAGDIVPHVGRVFSLDAAADAHALSETGHGRGRIVLHIAD